MPTILIIDDSPTEASVVSKYLQEAGYKVLWAINAEDGIEMAEQTHPNLVFMDVVMPGMNGFQATRKLSTDPKTKDIPIVMLSTKDQTSDAVWAKRNGAKQYLVKPATRNEILDIVESLI